MEKPDIIDTVAHHNETVESDIHIKAGVSGRIQTACAKNIGMRCSSRHDLQPADVLADAASFAVADQTAHINFIAGLHKGEKTDAHANLHIAAMMVILLIQHFTGLAQILQARGFPMNHTMFVALAWSINQNSTMIMAQALVFLIPAVASIVAGFRMKTHDVPGANEATLRRHKVFRRHAIAAAVWSLIAAIGVTATLTVGVAATHQTITLSPPEAYSLKDGVATIPFSQVEDGHLHRFEYKAKDGTVMRFIIIKKNGGAYGIGLDACENCGDAGYYEKDGKIICNKSEVAINLATIGFKGGCNPIPFPYKTGHGKITIQTTDLDALSAHFR